MWNTLKPNGVHTNTINSKSHTNLKTIYFIRRMHLDSIGYSQKYLLKGNNSLISV